MFRRFLMVLTTLALAVPTAASAQSTGYTAATGTGSGGGTPQKAALPNTGSDTRTMIVGGVVLLLVGSGMAWTLRDPERTP